MRFEGTLAVLGIGITLGTGSPAEAAFPKSPVTKCAPDSVVVGTTCVDTWEASAWQIPAAQTSLIKKVQKGRATLADLTAGGAVQLGCTAVQYGHTAYPATFPENGNWTTPVYAASVAGVLPSACLSWFQAEQACRLSGKRLLINQEWQAAAAGTPDPGATPGAQDCNTNGSAPVVDRSNCRSSWGAANMIGNVWEWVGDWGDLADGATNWSAVFGSDYSAVGGPGSSYNNRPGALFRGGDWASGAPAGVFAVNGSFFPSDASSFIGFRCGR